MSEAKPTEKEGKEGRRFSQEQYEMLLRCSEKKDMTEWNEWRENNPKEEILLEFAEFSHEIPELKYCRSSDEKGIERDNWPVLIRKLREVHFSGADLCHAHLKGATLNTAHLENAELYGAYLEKAKLSDALLNKAILIEAHLEEADLRDSNLEDANLSSAHLEEALLCDANLKGANFEGAHLNKADLSDADLKGAYLKDAHLEEALLSGGSQKLGIVHLEGAHLEGANLTHAHLEGAYFQLAFVDGSTLIWECSVDHKTDFRGIGLDSARIDAGTRQLLEYNIRRMNWEDWYWGGPVHGVYELEYSEGRGMHRRFAWNKVWWLVETFPVRVFWWMSDYGMSTGRIIFTFLGLAVIFALVYWLWPTCIVVNGQVGNIKGWWHALYSSVVTPFGVGDISASPDSPLGQTLLMVQVISGYVLLGALVTRFAVLFTAGGPAGTFAEEKKDEK